MLTANARTDLLAQRIAVLVTEVAVAVGVRLAQAFLATLLHLLAALCARLSPLAVVELAVAIAIVLGEPLLALLLDARDHRVMGGLPLLFTQGTVAIGVELLE